MQQQRQRRSPAGGGCGGGSTRRPPVWQDDMAEVKETFRRVSLVKHSGFSTLAPGAGARMTAPLLSRNRRARARSQVSLRATTNLHVPVRLLHEIQSNRSQSPFVSLSHLQNVLSMCRRIRSQKSLTERRKNPHDPGVYPVFLRRPWSVNAYLHPAPALAPPLRGLSDPTPLSYKPARFKPLFDLSNGVYPYSDVRKRLSSRASAASSDRIRSFEKLSASCTDHVPRIKHTRTSQNLPPHSLQNPSSTSSPSPPKQLLTPTSFTWGSPEPDTLVIAKKARLKSSPIDESWPSSSSLSNDINLGNLLSSSHSLRIGALDYADLNTDRRPHSENDLNLHSASYFLERPPSRCMKRPLSSCSWRNAAGLCSNSSAFGDLSDRRIINTFTDAWSPDSLSSQMDGCIFIPRDLNGNILKDLSTAKTRNSEGNHLPTSNGRVNGSKPKSTAKESHLMRGKGLPCNSFKLSKGRVCDKQTASTKNKKKQPSTHSCLDRLEGLSPNEWAKRLTSDLMAGERKSREQGGHCDGHGARHRVKFASLSTEHRGHAPQVDVKVMQAQSPAEWPDLLSWERYTGLLTGDPPMTIEETDETSAIEDQSSSPMECSTAGVSGHVDEADNRPPSEEIYRLQGGTLYSENSLKPCGEASASVSEGQCHASEYARSVDADDEHGGRVQKIRDADTELSAKSMEVTPALESPSLRSPIKGLHHGQKHLHIGLIEVLHSSKSQVLMQAEETSPKVSGTEAHHEVGSSRSWTNKTSKGIEEPHHGQLNPDASDDEGNDGEHHAALLDESSQGLEKLFKDSLDLNPTFRHLYDTMSQLGEVVN